MDTLFVTLYPIPMKNKNENNMHAHEYLIEKKEYKM